MEKEEQGGGRNPEGVTSSRGLWGQRLGLGQGSLETSAQMKARGLMCGCPQGHLGADWQAGLRAAGSSAVTRRAQASSMGMDANPLQPVAMWEHGGCQIIPFLKRRWKSDFSPTKSSAF